MVHSKTEAIIYEVVRSVPTKASEQISVVSFMPPPCFTHLLYSDRYTTNTQPMPYRGYRRPDDPIQSRFPAALWWVSTGLLGVSSSRGRFITDKKEIDRTEGIACPPFRLARTGSGCGTITVMVPNTRHLCSYLGQLRQW